MFKPYPLCFSMAGVPTAGAVPTWKAFQYLTRTVIPMPKPVISDQGNGLYLFYWDVAIGEVHGVVDWGATVGTAAVSDADRYSFVSIFSPNRLA